MEKSLLDKGEALTFFSVLLGVSVALVITRAGEILLLRREGRVYGTRPMFLMFAFLIFAHVQCWTKFAMFTEVYVTLIGFAVVTGFLLALCVVSGLITTPNYPDPRTPGVPAIDLSESLRKKLHPGYAMLAAAFGFAIAAAVLQQVREDRLGEPLDYVQHAIRVVMLAVMYGVFRPWRESYRWQWVSAAAALLLYLILYAIQLYIELPNRPIVEKVRSTKVAGPGAPPAEAAPPPR